MLSSLSEGCAILTHSSLIDVQDVSARWRADTFRTIDSTVNNAARIATIKEVVRAITVDYDLSLDDLPGAFLLPKAFSSELFVLVQSAYEWNRTIKVEILKCDFVPFFVEPQAQRDPMQMEPFEKPSSPIPGESYAVSCVSLGLIATVSLRTARASIVQRKAQVLLPECLTDSRVRTPSVLPQRNRGMTQPSRSVLSSRSFSTVSPFLPSTLAPRTHIARGPLNPTGHGASPPLMGIAGGAQLDALPTPTSRRTIFRRIFVLPRRWSRPMPSSHAPPEPSNSLLESRQSIPLDSLKSVAQQLQGSVFSSHPLSSHAFPTSHSSEISSRPTSQPTSMNPTEDPSTYDSVTETQSSTAALTGDRSSCITVTEERSSSFTITYDRASQNTSAEDTASYTSFSVPDDQSWYYPFIENTFRNWFTPEITL